MNSMRQQRDMVKGERRETRQLNRRKMRVSNNGVKTLQVGREVKRRDR